MPQKRTKSVGALVGLGAATLLAACFVSADHKKLLTCDEAAERGYICEPSAGASGAGAAGTSGTSGIAGSPLMGSGGGGMGGLGGGGAGGSGGLMCAAPTVACDGACVDVKAADANNCGACGRSCLGAAMCAAGACVPEPMASNEVAPYAVTIDGTNLYWASPAIKEGAFVPSIRRLSKTTPGSAKADVFAPGSQLRARSLTLSADGRFLFWGSLNDNALYRGDLQATPFPNATAIEGGEGDVQHVVFVDPKVYWTNGTSGVVRGKNPADADGVVGPEIVLQDKPGWLAVDGTDTSRLYWVAGLGARSVRRQSAAGSNVAAEFASGAPLSVEIAGGVVYWAERDTQALRSAPTSTTTLPTTGVTLVAQAGAVEGFALDAGATPPRIYWVSFNAVVTPKVLEIWRATLTDGSDKLLLGQVPVKDQETYGGNPFGAAHVRVDNEYIYFADVGTVDTTQVVPTSQGNGVIYRVAK